MFWFLCLIETVSASSYTLSCTSYPSTGTSGVTLNTTPFELSLLDSSNVGVSGVSVYLETSSNFAISGTTVQTTDSNGDVTFSDITVNTVGSVDFYFTAVDSSNNPYTLASPISVTISQGSAASLAFTTQPTSTSAGTTFSAAVTAYDSFGVVVTSYAESVTLSILSSSTLDGTASVSASSGVASFSGLSATTTGTYVLQASDGSLTAYSNQFTISPGSATSITITSIARQVTGVSFTISSSLYDAYSNLLAYSNTLTVSKASGSGTLSCTSTSVTSSTGTFSHICSLNAPGTYALTMTHSSVSATSNSFIVSFEIQLALTTTNYLLQGNSFAYTITALDQPATSFTLTLTSSNPTYLTLSSSSITVSSTSSYNTANTVTVTAAVNTGSNLNSYTIAIASSDGTYNSFDFVTCNPDYWTSSGTLTVEVFRYLEFGLVTFEGTPVVGTGVSGTYTAVLDSQPTASVVVTPSPPYGVSVTPSSLTFTNSNYNTPQSFTVSLSSSRVVSSSLSFSITHSVASTDTYYSDPLLVPTTVLGAYLNGVSASVILSGSIVFQEGRSGYYSVQLATQPADSVTITLTTDASGVLSLPVSTLTFTTSDWDTLQYVEVQSAEGSTSRGYTYSGTITHAVTSSDSNFNTVTPTPSATLTATVVQACQAGYYSWPPGSGACAKCPLGYSCKTVYAAPVACSSGTYSNVGDWLCIPCPAGYYCSGSTLPQACTSGSYSTGSASSCTACTGICYPDGSLALTACPAGTFYDGGFCKTCLGGYSCSTGSLVACSSGKYSLDGISTCDTAVAGSMAYDPTIAPVICPRGYYSSSTSSQCTACPAGSSCTSTSVSSCSSTTQYSMAGAGVCSTYSTYGQLETSTEVRCQPGKAPVSNSCTAVAAGYYSNGFSSIPCPDGTAATATGSVRCTPCGLGNYCSVSTACSSCTSAAAGSYSSSTYQQSLPCLPGFYSSSSGAFACLPCTDGYYCPAGSTSATETICPAGSYCVHVSQHNPSTDDMQGCPPGYYLTTTGGSSLSSCVECPAGSFCNEDASATTTCPAGFFCFAASAYGTPCKSGTYVSTTGSTDQTDCGACSQGNFCPLGTSSPITCNPGNYCPTSSGTPFPGSSGTYSASTGQDAQSQFTTCPAGQICPQGSIVPLNCEVGTYNPNTGGEWALEDCLLCTAGSSCPTLGLTAVVSCDAGFVCRVNTAFPYQFPCPGGTQSDSTSNTAWSSCSSCTAGTFCLDATNTSNNPPYPCPRGNYCGLSTANSYTNPCPAGYYQDQLSQTASSDCTLCPAGRYCARGSWQYSTPCAQGYYCPLGTTLPTPSTSACAAGTYLYTQHGSLSTDCVACPTGYYCLAGSSAPTPCPAGSYAGSTNTLGASIGTTGNCASCTAGYYCPEGTTTPIACEAGYYSLAGAWECTICPAGSVCPTTATSSLTSCIAGHYCAEGSSSDTTLCPAGYYCSSPGTTAPVPCTAGTESVAGSTSCTSATAGYYSIEAAPDDTGYCAPGYYCPLGSAGPYEYACPANSFVSAYGSTSSSACTTCSAGFYCPIGTASPIICPAGSYCPASATAPTMCPIGYLGLTTGLTSSSACTLCTAGYYCSQPGLSVPDGLCSPGYSCVAGSSSSTPSTASATCAAGGYCEPGFPTQLPCDPGSFNPTTGAEDRSFCQPCPASYYCLGTETSGTTNPCAAGYYCPTSSYSAEQNISPPGTYSLANQASATSCAVTTYNPEYHQTSCTTCPAGFYCGSIGMLYPTVCPAGAYCVIGQSETALCPQGTFMPQGYGTSQSSCIACTPGYYCPSNGLSAPAGQCNPGFWCTTSSVSQNPSVTTAGVSGPCPSGYYCPTATPQAIPCPSGTYLSTTGNYEESQCVSCSLGSYCDQPGLSAVAGSCLAGYYCKLGARTSSPPSYVSGGNTVLQYCVAGQFCVTGSSDTTDCLEGTYQDLDYQSTCNNCPGGYYCPPATSIYESNPCPAGYFCPGSVSSANQNPCPVGTYSPNTLLISSANCLPCTPGYYCATPGLQTPTGACTGGYFCRQSSTTPTPLSTSVSNTVGAQCQPGYYCPAGGNVAKVCDAGMYCSTAGLGDYEGPCSAGYYCSGGAYSSTPTDGTTGAECPAGYYCPSGSTAPTPCPAGTYSSSLLNTESSDCIECPAGYYCSDAAQNSISSAVLCTAGYYCDTGENLQYPTTQCAAGQYCPAGSSAALSCNPGTYQELPLQSSCNSCPFGYYCPDSEMTSATPCTAGNYCPIGASDLIACPAGSYNPLGLQGSASSCINCPPGMYCTGGGSSPDGDCDAGYYCTGSAVQSNPSDTTGNICPIGFYCPSGTPQALNCPPGYYCGITGISSPSTQCLAGYYCIQGAQVSTPRDGTTGDVCPSGYYCLVGTSIPTPCPRGTFSNLQGNSASSDCQTCTAGSYCTDLAGTGVSGSCTAGYYCPAGSVTSTPTGTVCPAGSYCPAQSAAPISCSAGTYQYNIGSSSCNTCPAGFTCEGSTNAPVLCQAGYQCPQGSAVATMVACGIGTYQPFTGQSSCLVCPMGYYCGTGPVTSPTLCPTTAYCVAGTSSPPPFCNPGTYSTVTGLQQNSQCAYCPSDKYCTSGVIQGYCSASYLCTAGVNTPTPDGYSSTGTGGLCPIGHYCPIATSVAPARLPIPCPLGTARTEVGGAVVGDCSACQAGYYCISNNPVPQICPAGAYCPTGSSSPTNCTITTYNGQLGATSSASCLSCPAGYICDLTGVSDYNNYPCYAGSYCPAGSTSATPSPKGYYSPSYNAGSVSACLLAPAGHYSTAGSAIYTACPLWNYCPTGSYAPTNCTAGNFCPTEAASGTTCPQGWYCPQYNATEFPPIRCPAGEICPTGSGSPTSCALGTVYTKTYSWYDATPTCVGCPAGAYSLADATACAVCNPGYVCLGNTTIPYPTDINLHKGYQCGTGYFCPAGSTYEQACPAGSYNPSNAGTSLASCVSCPSLTYIDLPASSFCKVCGLYATSGTGAITCTPRGKHRAFQKSDKSCPCANTYEHFDSSGNVDSSVSGVDDCVPIVYDRCNSGEVFDTQGNCVANDYCPDCPNGGTRTSGLPCTCNSVQDVHNVCGTACQANCTQVTYSSNGVFTFYDPTSGNTTYLSSSNVTGLTGSMSCSSQYTNCNVVSGAFNGAAQAYFQPTLTATSTTSPSSRRRLSSTLAITNPMVCLTIGQTMLFDLALPDHYPVYINDTLLSNEGNFDYSAFETLNSEASTSNATVFGFTFTTSGMFLFEDASNSSQQMMVTVMANGTQCPLTPVIQPITSTSLSLVGAKQSGNIVLSIDWWAVLGVMLVLFVSIIICSALFYYYNKMTWMLPERKTAAYREKQKKLIVTGDLTQRSSMDFYLGGDRRDDDDAMYIRDLIFKEVPELINIERSAFTDENDNLDSSILQAILDQLRDCQKTLLDELQKPSVDALINQLKEEFDDLQNAVERQLKEISMPPHIKAIFEQGNVSALDDSVAYSEAVSRPGELDYQALQRIANDPGLSEADRQKLMDEMNTQLKMMDESLKLDRTEHDSELRRRLKEREDRRAKLAAEKQRLVEEEKQLSRIHDEERRTLAIKQNQLDEIRMAEDKDDRDAVRRELIGPEADALKQRIDAAIAANPSQKERLLKEYEDSLKLMEQNLSMNQLRQQQDLAKRLEERRRARKREADQKSNQLKTELEARQEREVQDLQARKRDLAVQEALAVSAAESNNELENIEARHRQEQNELLRSLDSQEDQMAASLMRKKTMLNDSQNKARLAELEVERERLELALKTADEPTRVRLLQELQANQEVTADLMRRQADKQKIQLEARLELRRKKRQEQMEALKVKQQQEKEELEAKIRAAEEKKKAEKNEAAIEKLKDELSPEELPEAIKLMLAAKHQEEIDKLIKAQSRRTRQRLRDLLEETLREKGDELQALRQQFKDRRTQVEENASVLGAAEVANQLKSLEFQEADALARLDFTYLKKSDEQQKNATRDMIKRNNDEMLELIDRQLAEARDLLAKSGLTKEQKIAIHDEQKKRKAELEQEAKLRLIGIAARHAELDAEKEAKNKELEALIKEERDKIEADRKQAASEAKRRELADRRRRLKEELQRGHLTEEEIERLLEDEQKKLAKIDSTLNREREKQQAKLSQKLIEKRSKLQETHDKMQKMREEQEVLQSALMKAPPLDHIEAQNLLLKWRRYPKKQHRDVLNSISTKEAYVQWQPTRATEVKAQVVSKSETLRELMERVDRIETIATNVDSVQFEAARKAFSSLSSSLA